MTLLDTKLKKLKFSIENIKFEYIRTQILDTFFKI